jgi:hypothetical protein
MGSFVRKQNQPQERVSSILARPNLATSASIHYTHPDFHIPRTIGNQAVQRMSEATMEGGKGKSTTTEIAHFDYDFSKIPINSSDRNTSIDVNDNNWDMGTRVKHYKHTFSAAIGRVRSTFQHDSMSDNEREPAADSEAQATQILLAPGWRSIPEPKEAETVHFPENMLTSATLPEQSDRIVSNFGYKSSIAQQGPPPRSGEFGTTRPFYAFEKPGPSATQRADTFDVTGTIVAEITFQVAGHNRTDIASHTDPAITQTNYPIIVSDFIPSPTTVTRGTEVLYKNQPPRTKFWANDLTIKHERFHADEDVKFGQQGVIEAQNWLNRQTARDYDEVGALLNRVAPIVARSVDAKMTLPGRELRAYADGAADYRGRAQAIKDKGDSKGYVSRTSAPQTPGSTPLTIPNMPGMRRTPIHNEPPPK